ncbi:MFS transporter [Nocardiopsis sp. MG754419]|uniref:MFS transporter n=1 Tax=Nocardiopsis sp. MG754419 TaxID=2259865 RepID=UPI001BA8C0BA|nr:MFS transporter [Nocardiopsis sp. MG754419]MBR8744387.1 MFS transporter [Nocardiopsis sp. MG754419]
MGNPRIDEAPDNEDHESSKAQKTRENEWRSSYRDVMAIREFRSIWLAHALSVIGNNLLNIATALLVYHVTASAFAAGVTLALNFLPPLIGGPLLSGLADILPRRQVMIACDVLRAGVIVLMGVPGMPVWAIWVLMFFVVLPGIPFAAARAALLTQIIQGERYVASTTIIQLTAQVGMLLGLIAGGVTVSLIGPNITVMGTGLLFALSALIVLFGVRHRPVPPRERDAADQAEGKPKRPGLLSMFRGGAKLVFTDAELRTLVLLAWLAGLYGIPYGLATPMADEAGAGATATGFIMAGASIGALFGGLILTRLVPPPTRMRLLGPLAVLTSVPLLLWFFQAPLWLMIVALALCGAAGSYQFVANAAFVLCVPQEGRAQAFGLAASGLQVAQGLGILLASYFVESFGTGPVIAWAGVIGVVGASVLALQWSRMAGATIARMQKTEKGNAP